MKGKEPVRILHLDDDPIDAELVTLALERAKDQLHAKVTYVQTKQQFLGALERCSFDIILSDYRMPGFDGDEALKVAREKCPEVPFIMVTGELGEERAIETLQRGATDYVLKDRMFRLVPAIERALEEAEILKKQREAEEAFRESENRFRIMADSTPVMIWVTNADGEIIMVNKTCEESLGLTQTDLEQHGRWQTVLHPEDAPQYVATFLEAIRTHAPFDAEARIRHKSGQWRWVHSYAVPRFSSDGMFLGLVGSSPDITRRKEAEEALLESEQKLRAMHQNTSEIVESFKDPLYVVDSEWRITYINEKALELWDKTRDEVLAKVVWELYPAATHQRAYDTLQEAMRKRQSVTFENWTASLKRWVEVRAYPTAGGGLTLSYPDITERKKAEERIEDLARFPGENPSPILRIRSGDGKLLYANQASAPLLKVWNAVVGEEAPPALKDLVRRLGTERQGIDVPAADRVYAFLSVQIPERDYINLYGRDVTERKRAEEALAESEGRFRTLADNIPQLAWMTDATGWIFWYNQRWFDYTGTTLPEMEGWGWQKVHHPDHVERVTEKFRRAVEIGQPWEDTFPLRGKTGEYRWFLSRAFPIRDEQGKITRWFGTNTDITEQREAEEAIRTLNEELEAHVRERTAQLERANRELESFSYTVSHDLKAPLRAISGFTRILAGLQDASLSEKQQDYLNKIQSSTTQMDKLIESLLAFSRTSRQVMHSKPVDMRSLAEEVIKEQRQILGEAAGRVQVTLGEFPPGATGDPVLLRQVFANLIANAFKFTGKVAEALIEVGGYQENGEFIYYVRDNGAGFPPKQAEKLFQVFQRLHAHEEFEGTGIGLANVRKIIERHGGRVCAEGEEGKGATFYFTLPSLQEPDS